MMVGLRRWWLVALACAASLMRDTCAKQVALGTYDDNVYDKFLLIFYYTWWCGEACSSVLPAWKGVEDVMSTKNRVFVGEIDCAAFTSVQRPRRFSRDFNGGEQGTIVIVVGGRISPRCSAPT